MSKVSITKEGQKNQELIAGQPFIPYKRFIAAHLPLSILRHKGLSDGAKLLYGRLCLFAGRDGRITAGRETMARDLGASLASIRRYLHELVSAKLILRARRGPNQTAVCHLLWHECLTDSLLPDGKKMTHQDGVTDDEDLTHTERADGANLTRVDGLNVNRPYKENEEIQYKEIQSSSVPRTNGARTSAALPAAQTDERSTLGNCEPAAQLPRSASWKPTPKELKGICNCLAHHLATDPDGILQNGLGESLFDEMYDNPKLLKPDLLLAARVSNHFANASDFLLWIGDLAGRWSGRKIRSWGFYETDAREIWPQRKAEVCRQREKSLAATELEKQTSSSDISTSEFNSPNAKDCGTPIERVVDKATRHCRKCGGEGILFDNANIFAAACWCSCEVAVRLKELKPETVNEFNRKTQETAERVQKRGTPTGSKTAESIRQMFIPAVAVSQCSAL